ncbi:MAG: molecular chaperone SurA [Sideroxydans sp.]|nr:molecular chaperone SurA [Sideroxydans sp.]
MLRNKTIFAMLLWLACVANVQADDPQKQVAPIDQIVAVVNDDVITRNELDERIDVVKKQLQRQGTPLPAAEILQKQLLERMIMDMLQAQYAKETGVRVDDAEVDKSLQRIAQQNNFPSVDAFKAKLEEQGVDFKKFREEIRGEIIATRLREREVDSKLIITESEVDNYLATEAKQMGKGEEYHLAHIFVVIPEQASAEKIQASQQRANEALNQLHAGADFAQVAAGFSDAKDALQGGDLGWRPSDQIPPGFREVLQKMQPGEVSPLLRSPNGFHIIKLVDRRHHDTPMLITQTHVRHILIKTSDLVPDSEARSRLLDIKRRIEGGASFAEQARLYSEDGSASQGGDLGWISPGETIPEFEKAMNALQPGEMSGPVQTGFGWHLIQVLERRTTDVSEEQKRQQARLAIRAFKSDEAWQDWLRQLRDRAYVEYRDNN